MSTSEDFLELSPASSPPAAEANEQRPAAGYSDEDDGRGDPPKPPRDMKGTKIDSGTTESADVPRG